MIFHVYDSVSQCCRKMCRGVSLLHNDSTHPEILAVGRRHLRREALIPRRSPEPCRRQDFRFTATDARTSALLLQRTRQLPVSRQQQQLLNNLTVQNCITGVRFPEESDHLLWSLREKWNGSLLYILRPQPWGSPGGSGVKNPPCNARDIASIPGPGRPHTRRSN